MTVQKKRLTQKNDEENSFCRDLLTNYLINRYYNIYVTMAIQETFHNYITTSKFFAIFRNCQYHRYPNPIGSKSLSRYFIMSAILSPHLDTPRSHR